MSTSTQSGTLRLIELGVDRGWWLKPNPMVHNAPKTHEVIARYSILKVVGWTMLVVFVSVSVLMEAASHNWRPLEPQGWLAMGAAVDGSVVILIFAAGLLLNLTLSRGVAIARINNEFVLYFPFSRKRVPVSNVTVSAGEEEITLPSYGLTSLFKPSKVVAKQVTIHCLGQTDLNFRTGLLRENAAIIAERMTALAKGYQRADHHS